MKKQCQNEAFATIQIENLKEHCVCREHTSEHQRYAMTRHLDYKLKYLEYDKGGKCEAITNY